MKSAIQYEKFSQFEIIDLRIRIDLFKGQKKSRYCGITFTTKF